jgi:D-mannonate dehydratase
MAIISTIFFTTEAKRFIEKGIDKVLNHQKNIADEQRKTEDMKMALNICKGSFRQDELQMCLDIIQKFRLNTK